MLASCPRAASGVALLFGLLSSSAFAQPVTITDLTGRQIELTGPAERIVAFPVPTASVVIALDGGIDRLAALHPEAKVAIEDGILGEFFPDAKTLPNNILADGAIRGRKPNVAALQALDPDLVVQWEHAGPDAEVLLDAGFPTALLLFGSEEYIRNAITMLGDAIGKPDKVAELMAWRDETSDAIGEGLAGLEDSDKPKVAYFFYALTDLHTEGTGTFADWQINHVGGVNAAAGMEGWGQVDIEEVAAWNPDIILLGTFERGLHIDRILDEPILRGTNAVMNKRVYKMPLGGYRWEPASHESPFTWMWLANLLHADRFDFDVRGAVAEWYPKLYGHAPTEAQIDGILQMGENGASAGYDVFAAK
ncbi:MAG: ABC transporter substrate-binding protein [Dongiaceae bacterium]